MAFRFEDYQVYKDARELFKVINELCVNLPKKEVYVLTDQIRRATLSVVLNIAEGYSRESVKERRNFLRIAMGSAGEVVACLDIMCDIGYLSGEQRGKIYKSVEEIAKQLNKLVHKPFNN
ncbi:four helix bundle protein [Patescibacteria group bacterium]|nr:four helix bundle protein [Patescibacteria group bacterium]MBU1868097.1 four helix bundle protein [Patescibacteria group bacterium]